MLLAAKPDRVLRAITFGALLLFMLAGPLMRQVFDSDRRVFREWQMYGNIGIQMIVLDVEHHHNGTWQTLDYVTNLKQVLQIPPNRALRINRIEAIDPVKAHLCRLYPRKRLRSSIRQASKTDGWIEIEHETELKCRSKL